MYDGLLREQLPAGVEFLAYADDVALVTRGKDVCILERLLTSDAGVIVEWMASMGLELALHKSEAMVITNSKTHNDMRITIKGTEIATVPCIKYLGIHLDAKLNFTTHAMYVSAKASKVAANLARILPNISQAKPRKRRLLSGVVHSILLYGAPVWADRMSQSRVRQVPAADHPKSGLCLLFSLCGRRPGHRRYPSHRSSRQRAYGRLQPHSTGYRARPQSNVITKLVASPLGVFHQRPVDVSTHPGPKALVSTEPRKSQLPYETGLIWSRLLLQLPISNREAQFPCVLVR